MDKLDDYLHKHEYIIYKKLVKNFSKFDYEDEIYLMLDLNLLLDVKHKKIKVYKSKKYYLKGIEYNYNKIEFPDIAKYNDTNTYYEF